MSKTYRLVRIEDLLQIPAARREIAVLELLDALAAIEVTRAVARREADRLGLPLDQVYSDDLVRLEGLTWVDDDKGELRFNVSVMGTASDSG